jgi:hypothetical protein
MAEDSGVPELSPVSTSRRYRRGVRRRAQNHIELAEARAVLAKQVKDDERAEADAKTAKLRALRLAREEAERGGATTESAQNKDSSATPTPDTVDGAAFRLSRIFAEGWNAARKLEPDAFDGMNPQRMAALNPYTVEAERARWTEGFTKGLSE